MQGRGSSSSREPASASSPCRRSPGGAGRGPCGSPLPSSPQNGAIGAPAGSIGSRLPGGDEGRECETITSEESLPETDDAGVGQAIVWGGATSGSCWGGEPLYRRFTLAVPGIGDLERSRLTPTVVWPNDFLDPSPYRRIGRLIAFAARRASRGQDARSRFRDCYLGCSLNLYSTGRRSAAATPPSAPPYHPASSRSLSLAGPSASGPFFRTKTPWKCRARFSSFPSER